MKNKIYYIMSIFGIFLLFAGCDMGTPAPSGNISKKDKKIAELAAKKEYYKILNITFKDGTYIWISVFNEGNGKYAVLPSGKKIKLKNDSALESAYQIFGAEKVQKASW